jgi:hypothetical protein
MTYTQLAGEIVTKAERELRDLMKRAIDDHRYSEVAAIAALADAVAGLLGPDGPSTVSLSSFAGLASSAAATPQTSSSGNSRNGARLAVASAAAATSAPPAARGRKTRQAAGKPAKYPRFRRDGDRLVKIGWSKKDRRTYEHRAPRDIVMAVVRQLASSTTPGKVFTIEPLLPFRDDHGQDIPAYQPYLVLKWLQHIDAVRKKGKDGYIIPAKGQGGGMNNDRITQAWNALS